MSRFFGVLLGCAMLMWVIGCGGSNTPAPTPTPTPTPSAAATVTTTSTTVPLSTTQLFTANNFSATVTWSVSPAVGTIDQTGLYHAPATFPSPNTVTVTATAGTQTASDIVTIVFPNDNAISEATPVKLGTSGGNVTDTSTTSCCIGTMGSLWTRADLAQPVILSNNHVLDRSSFGTPGQSIAQPGPTACFGGSSKPIAILTAGAPLAPAGTAQGRTGASPSNTDSAIAQIVPGAVDLAGTILDLGAAGSTSIAAAPPSSTIAAPALNMAVAKSGRTTGLTCSTIGSIKADIQVDYETSCGSKVTAFTATYRGQVMINGGSFSAGGDSGSLIVNSANAQPVALLYGGSPTDTVANPLLDDVDSLGNPAPGVITALSSGTNVLTPIPSNPDHAVSCAPTAVVTNAKQVGTLSTGVPLSATESQRITAVQQKNRGLLMQNSAISSLAIGGSADSASEGALIIHLSHASAVPIPAVMDGVRTRVVFDQDSVSQPSVGQAQIDRAAAVKDAHVAEYLGQPGIQGVGVAISSDNPAETAISIYVIKGVSHQIIPPVIDGVRTKIFESERFKAF